MTGKVETGSTGSVLSTWFDFKFKLLAGGLAVGLISGVGVVLYRYSLETALDAALNIYAYQRTHLWLIPLWFAVLIAGGWITGLLVKKQPMIAGSGIPQVKGVLKGKLAMNWWRVFLGKFIGGTLSIGAGLSLGREGPSIQIGASLAQGFSRLTGKMKTEENFLITCGASAGLAAAFNAPIAGVIFALEELHSSFSPFVMMSALAASLTADFVSKEFFGLSPIFHISGLGAVPLSQYGHLLGLGAVVGCMGIAFNNVLYRFQSVYRRLPIRQEFKPVLPFVLAGIVGIFMPSVLGGGNVLVDDLVTNRYTIAALLLLLAVKWVFTAISFGSSAPGGIFLPMLVLGSITGVLYAQAVNGLAGHFVLEPSRFLILAMAGYLTASVKAPITGILLITEMTGSFSNLLSTGVVCLTAYMIAELFRSRPVYEVLLSRIVDKNGPDEPEVSGKTLIEIPVHPGSTLDGRRIKEHTWPEYCLIVAIRRGELELIPGGEARLQGGDYLIILTDNEYASRIRDCLAVAAADYSVG
ncbi:ClC family H(+)/Cl(-) exchange transporter [Paenibacillus sp. HN-1]|uniref:ClC family H(+)/Cl(-) exchange transporter n=1 Tax=Paenibacillus TaxID=44249 RepID=UPI001CAA012F|nr:MULTISPECIES: ClC family H(+)/Cl(-) exchange transporter [Paenibacillus]MBY9077437.1 ClC family H(+)/Cl(-) exchange transporter [Paenibacillus sp. CGMCC 1.18879]MBY9084786.1 ClC family H(+)/Cl(-) exchange transporter [Paenibacillus sinensis]